MEFDYNFERTHADDTSGSSVTSKSTNFLQRYNLDYRQPLYPTLTLGLGYILEKDLTTSTTNDIDSRTTFFRTSPSANLTFRNPFATALVGYNQVAAKTETSGSPPQTLLQDNVNAAFALTRTGNLPTFNLGYGWSHAYDKNHLIFDSVTQAYLLSSTYRPVKQLEMRYSGSYSDIENKLNSTETTGQTHTGRFNYNDDFMNKRLMVYSSYDISMTEQQTRVSGTATGEVTEQILLVAGLSGSGPAGTDTPPEIPTLDTLISNGLLIDGNTTASSGVNIGYSVTVTTPRNMGLDLGVATELNSIYVWVSQRLPASVANSFSWDVYVSSDTTPQKQWTLVQTVAPAPFGVFDNRFELRFANVTTRFIKVVTRPLASPTPVPGVDINNILVTELQAFIIRPVQGAGTTATTRGTGERIEAGATARLAKTANLTYDVNYWQIKTALQGAKRDGLTNRLSAGQRLSRIFSTSAMVTRGDSHEADGRHVNYIYNASLTAAPLNTLNHTLMYTRTTDKVGGLENTSDIVYLNNNATPYRGVGVNLALTQGDTKAYTGQRTKSNSLTAGSTLTPNRSLTFNFYYTDMRSKTTGDTTPENTTVLRSSAASVSYSPFETLYLFASYSTSKASSLGGSTPTSRTTTYTLSWLPTLGDLWFNLTASQILTSVDKGETDTVSPQAHWNINSYMTLEGGYQLTTAKNYLMRSRTDTFFATLRVLL